MITNMQSFQKNDIVILLKFQMIIFEKFWKNFLSTGNHSTEVILSSDPTTLIVGSNGAGKSTILDALTFSLYGKSFK